MRAWFARLMAGRNGADNLCRFTSVVTCIMLFASIIIGGDLSRALWLLSIIGIIYTYFRAFSRNITKRRAENERFLARRKHFFDYFRGAKDRSSQRKEYKFFRCPSCRTMLRVPRGKGKIKIVCRKCGTSFIGKT